MIAHLCQQHKHQCAKGPRENAAMGAASNFSRNVSAVIADRGLTVNGAATAWKMPTKTLEAVVKQWRVPSLDTAERVAEAAGYELWQLLSADFHPSNPPIMRAVNGAEAELYERLRALAKDVPPK